MDLKRRPDESNTDYQVRLCRDKDVYGLSWQDVADALNAEFGTEYASSTYRKWYTSFSDGVEYAQSQRLNADEVIQEYEDKRIEMQKERVRLADQRRAYSQLVRDQARFEYIVETLKSSMDKLSERKPMVFDYTPSTTHIKRAAHLLATDWHRGMFAENYWNVYNNEEFDRRVKRLTEQAVLHIQRHDVDEINVSIGGDMIEGLLHVSSRIQSTEDVITQVENVSESMAEMLFELSKQFKDKMIKVRYIYGNHGRSTPALDASQNKENYDRLIPWHLKTRFRDVGNIKLIDNTYDDSIIDANIAGWDVMAVHGNYDTPNNVVQNLTLMTGKKPSYVYMGHLHKYLRDEVHGTYVILSPALCGTNEYAKNKRLTSNPAQLLTIFDENEGELATYPIRLDIA